MLRGRFGKRNVNRGWGSHRERKRPRWKFNAAPGSGVQTGPSKCNELQPSASSTKLQLAIGLPVAWHLTSCLFRGACSCTDYGSVTGSVGWLWAILRPPQLTALALNAVALSPQGLVRSCFGPMRS
ncbi:hypothetical protein LY76DRAFT_22808 [Colletotrichum caudatum]|nr:hypothetical protein LY76DRAFT_22808 [Colletotrichum caudatum]